MNLTELARRDWHQISTSDNGPGVEIKLTAPNSTTLITTGLFTKHHLGINESGQAVNSRTVHFSISEKQLIDASYPYRTDGIVNLRRHYAEIKDSTGVTTKYIIREWMPDETLGVILCVLGEFKD